MLIKSYLQGWVVMISKIIPSSFRIFLVQWQIDKEGSSFGQLTLEDINEKFDTMIEGQNLLNEKPDRHIDEDRAWFSTIKRDLRDFRKDLNRVA